MRSRVINVDQSRIVGFVYINDGHDIVTVHNRSGLSFMKMMYHLFTANNNHEGLKALIFHPEGMPPVMHIDDMNAIMFAGGEYDFMCSLYEFPVGISQEKIDKEVNGW